MRITTAILGALVAMAMASPLEEMEGQSLVKKTLCERDGGRVSGP